MTFKIEGKKVNDPNAQRALEKIQASPYHNGDDNFTLHELDQIIFDSEQYPSSSYLFMDFGAKKLKYNFSVNDREVFALFREISNLVSPSVVDQDFLNEYRLNIIAEKLPTVTNTELIEMVASLWPLLRDGDCSSRFIVPFPNLHKDDFGRKALMDTTLTSLPQWYRENAGPIDRSIRSLESLILAEMEKRDQRGAFTDNDSELFIKTVAFGPSYRIIIQGGIPTYTVTKDLFKENFPNLSGRVQTLLEVKVKELFSGEELEATAYHIRSIFSFGRDEAWYYGTRNVLPKLEEGLNAKDGRIEYVRDTLRIIAEEVETQAETLTDEEIEVILTKLIELFSERIDNPSNDTRRRLIHRLNVTLGSVYVLPEFPNLSKRLKIGIERMINLERKFDELI